MKHMTPTLRHVPDTKHHYHHPQHQHHRTVKRSQPQQQQQQQTGPVKKDAAAAGKQFSIYGTGHDVIRREAIDLAESVLISLFGRPSGCFPYTSPDASPRTMSPTLPPTPPTPTSPNTPLPTKSNTTATTIPSPPPSPPHLPPLRSFLTNIVTMTRISLTTLLLALLYLTRLKALHPRSSGLPGAHHWLLLASLIAAAKYLHDDSYDNKTWSYVSMGFFSLSQVNRMEVEFLSHLRFRLRVGESDWLAFLRVMERKVWSERGGKVGAEWVRRVMERVPRERLIELHWLQQQQQRQQLQHRQRHQLSWSAHYRPL